MRCSKWLRIAPFDGLPLAHSSGIDTGLDGSDSTGKGDGMATAIIGIGRIGGHLARHLVAGGERVIVAARDEVKAAEFAKQLGKLASAASVGSAIAQADIVVFAVWFDTIKKLIAVNASLLEGKIVVDPSNPLKPDGNGGLARTLPEDRSAGEVIARLLPPRARYVKAFSGHTAQTLGAGAGRSPDRVAVFYATDNKKAARTIERLISTAGFDPVKAGGVKESIRIEAGGDLHEYGGLKGKVLNGSEARSAAAHGAGATHRRERLELFQTPED